MASPVFLKLSKFVDDSARIRDGVLKAADRRFRRAGSIIRGIGRRMVRRTKNAKSRPGETPRTHVKGGNIGAKSIIWNYDANRRLLTVGPTAKPGEDGEVLTALAFGGMSTLKIRRRGEKTKRGKRVYIKKRKNPASAGGETFEKKYPDLLKDLY